MTSWTTSSPNPDAPALTLERFTLLAEANGGDLARWPEEVRAAAAALVERDPAAAEALQAAAELDALLDPLFEESMALDPAPAPSTALTARILADAAAATPAPAVLARAARPAPSLWGRAVALLFGEVSPAASSAAGGALAAAAVSGLAVGLITAPVAEAPRAPAPPVLDYAFSDPDALMMAFADPRAAIDENDAGPTEGRFEDDAEL